MKLSEWALRNRIKILILAMYIFEALSGVALFIFLFNPSLQAAVFTILTLMLTIGFHELVMLHCIVSLLEEKESAHNT